MRFLKLVITLLVLGGFSTAVLARPAAPLRNVQVAGQVFFAGQPAAGVTVQARLYSCFLGNTTDNSTRGATAKSDAKGYYRLRIPSAPIGNTYVTALAGTLGTKGYASYCNPTALTGEDLTSKTKRFNIQLEPAKPMSVAEAQCIKAKGEWGWLSTKVQGCNIQYDDAGKLCTDSKMCKGGMCLAGRRDVLSRNPKPTGYCADSTYTKYQAIAEIKNGKITMRK